MKKWIVVLLLIGIAGAAGYFWGLPHLKSWQAKAEASRSPGMLTTAVVEQRDIHFTVMAAGDIGPAEQVSVRPEINGRIQTLPVDIGDRVKKDAILFTLDDKDLQIEKATRVTEIDGAKLQLEKSERNYLRSKQLFEAKLISQELFEDTKTEYELAKNALERSEKNLRLLEDRLSKTVIRAPFDCTVLTRPVSIGQAVSGSGGFNSGTEVLTIADLSKMIINAHVNQADVTRLAAGQEVDIQVDSVPGLRLKGTVERIAPQSTIKNNVKGYAARILLSHVDERVRPGMTANVSIPVASAENVVAVPLAAIFTEQGERFAFVLQENGAFEKRNVQIGLADYDVAEVQSGLSVGDVVALVPPEGVSFNAAALARPPGATQARAGAANPPASGASSTTGGSATPRPASPSGNRPGGTATSHPQSSVTR